MFAKLFVQKQDQSPEDSPGYFVKSQCYNCKQLHRDNPTTCEAFPDGIPYMILMGDFDHTFEFDYDEVSDSGVTFSPIDKP